MLLPTLRCSSFFLGLLLLICMSAGCRKAEVEPPPPPAPVQAVSAAQLPLDEWVELLGSTQPLPGRAARVTASVEGQVLSVLGDDKGGRVIEGQQVERGQVLVQLNDQVARANRDKVAATQAELKQLQEQADYAVELARIDVKRLEALRPEGSKDTELPLASLIDLQKARLSLKDAESKKKAIVERQEAAAHAELRALDEQLSQYTLRAPLTGRLGLIQVVPGQTLTVGTLVAEVVDLQEIDVLCFVPPRTFAQLRGVKLLG